MPTINLNPLKSQDAAVAPGYTPPGVLLVDLHKVI